MHIPTASAGVWVSQLEIGLVGLEVAMKMLVYMLFLIFFVGRDVLCHLLLLLFLELSLAVAQLTPTQPNAGQTGMSVAMVMSRHCYGKIFPELTVSVGLNEFGSKY